MHYCAIIYLVVVVGRHFLKNDGRIEKRCLVIRFQLEGSFQVRQSLSRLALFQQNDAKLLATERKRKEVMIYDLFLKKKVCNKIRDLRCSKCRDYSGRKTGPFRTLPAPLWFCGRKCNSFCYTQQSGEK